MSARFRPPVVVVLPLFGDSDRVFDFSALRRRASQEFAFSPRLDYPTALPALNIRLLWPSLWSRPDQTLVFVPVDKASLTLADPQVRKDLGPVGTRVTRARGLQVMSAIAVDEEGTPQGLLGQAYWSRTNEPHAVPAHRRPVQEKGLFR